MPRHPEGKGKGDSTFTTIRKVSQRDKLPELASVALCIVTIPDSVTGVDGVFSTASSLVMEPLCHSIKPCDGASLSMRDVSN